MESKFTTADAIAALSIEGTSSGTLCTNKAHLFGAFVGHFQQPLFGFLGRMGFSQADAEDIAQEVFLKAWRYRGSYNPKRSQPSTWLFTIARNTAMSKLSSTRSDGVSIDTVDVEADSRHLPERQLQNDQLRSALSQAIRQLPINDRCAIALFYIENLSNDEAARILQCKTAAFKTRLSRARAKLKAILNERGDSHG